MAVRGGVEPPIALHLGRISSAVQSTALPPLQGAIRRSDRLRSSRVLGEDGWSDKALWARIRRSKAFSYSIESEPDGLRILVLARFLRKLVSASFENAKPMRGNSH